MSPSDFRALVAQHKGVASSAILDMPKDEKINGVATGEKVPLSVNPRIKYVLWDGTEVTARQQDNGEFEILEGGSNLLKTGTTKAVAGSAVSQNDKYIVTIGPDGKSTQTPNPNYVPPEDRAMTPAEKAATEQAAQRIDVERQNAKTSEARASADALYQQTQTKIAEMNADIAAGRLKHDQAVEQFNEWYKTNIEGPLAQVHAEAAKITAQASATNADTARMNAQTSAGQLALDTRKLNEVTEPTQALTNALGVAQLGQTAGQDAIKNWLATAPLQVGSGFGGDFANALHTLSSGGGPVNFQGSDFTYNIPDFQTMANTAADQAVARLKSGLGSFGSMVGAPAPAVQPAPAPSPAVQPAPFPGGAPASDPASAAAMNDPQVLAWLTTHQGGA